MTLSTLYQVLRQTHTENIYVGLDTASSQLCKSQNKHLNLQEVFERALEEVKMALSRQEQANARDTYEQLKLLTRAADSYEVRYRIACRRFKRDLHKGIIWLVPDFFKRFLPPFFSYDFDKIKEERIQAIYHFRSFIYSQMNHLKSQEK